MLLFLIKYKDSSSQKQTQELTLSVSAFCHNSHKKLRKGVGKERNLLELEKHREDNFENAHILKKKKKHLQIKRYEGISLLELSVLGGQTGGSLSSRDGSPEKDAPELKL